MSSWRPSSAIRQIVIHCAATPNGRWTTVEDIDRWHGPDRQARGLKPFWRDNAKFPHAAPRLHHIGYHYVIYVNGAIVSARADNETGAHAGQPWNRTSLGICLIGMDRFSAAQWETLKVNVIGLRRRFPDIDRVMGHREVNPRKLCPGFDVRAWLDNDMKPLPNHIYEAVE